MSLQRKVRLVPMLAFVVLLLICQASADTSDNSATEDREPKLMGSKTTLIADMARELITKSYSNSQVLSLNLSNVLILLLLKAVLFSIGHFSGGGKSGGSWWGRTDPDQQPRSLPETGVSEAELVLLLGYLTGERKGDFGCLYRAACEDPTIAPQYVTASKTLLKAANVFSSVINVNPKYAHIVEGLEEATKKGGQCSRYVCKH